MICRSAEFRAIVACERGRISDCRLSPPWRQATAGNTSAFAGQGNQRITKSVFQSCEVTSSNKNSNRAIELTKGVFQSSEVTSSNKNSHRAIELTKSVCQSSGWNWYKVVLKVGFQRVTVYSLLEWS